MFYELSYTGHGTKQPISNGCVIIPLPRKDSGAHYAITEQLLDGQMAGRMDGWMNKLGIPNSSELLFLKYCLLWEVPLFQATLTFSHLLV